MKISRNRFHQSCATLTALAATAAVVVLGAGPFAASASAEPAPTVPPGVVFTLDPVYVLPALPHLATPTVTTTVPPAVSGGGDAPAGGDDEGCDGCLHPAEETPDPTAPLVRVTDDTTNPVYTHRNASTQGSPGCGNDPASPLYQPCPEETTTTTVPDSTTTTTVPGSTTTSTVPSLNVEDKTVEKTAEKAGVLAFTGSSSTLLFLGVGVLLAGAAVLVVAKLVRSRRVA